MAETFMAARRSVYPPGRWRSNYNSTTGKSADGFGSGLSNSNTYTHTSQTKAGSNTGNQQMSFKQHKTKPILVCHRCGQQGHKQIDCQLQNVTNTRLYVPRPSHSLDEAGLNRDTVTVVKIGSKWFKALVDSGSSQTLVREECLDEQSSSVWGNLSVRCIHGDVREYLKTDLTIEIDNQSYVLSVGIVEQAPYPVILGRDVPILVDLLQCDKELAEARVVTRAQAKQEEGTRQALQGLPFAKVPKVKKSRLEKRQKKVEGTKILEQLPKPCVDDIEQIHHNIVQLQRQD